MGTAGLGVLTGLVDKQITSEGSTASASEGGGRQIQLISMRLKL